MSVFLTGQPDPARIMSLLSRGAIDRALMLELRFASGTVYLSDRNIPFTDLKWGRTWVGVGDLGGIGDVSAKDGDLAPYREYLLGLPAGILTDDSSPAMGMERIPELVGNPSDYRGREAILYMQFFDREALDAFGRPEVVGHPFALDVSLMDTVSSSWTADGAVLALRCEGLLARKGAPLYGFLTARDQLRRFPGDNGLAYVPEVMSTQPTWTTW